MCIRDRLTLSKLRLLANRKGNFNCIIPWEQIDLISQLRSIFNCIENGNYRKYIFGLKILTQNFFGLAWDIHIVYY